MTCQELEWAVFVGGQLDGYSVSDRGDVMDPKGRLMGGSVSYNKQMEPYLRVKIRGKKYYVHRIVLWGFTDEEGEMVDHINGCTLDNRLSNLRWATNRQNQLNAVWKTNTSGFKNISYKKRDNLWVVHLRMDGKNKGRLFSTMHDALVWRDEMMGSDDFYRSD